MRLLKDEGHGDLSLVERYDDGIPPYAILSHTWGADGDEVTFKDLMEDTGKDKAGYKKINFCRDQAAKDGLQYFWVDTCCIDKSSSAELSEAINSMFCWYKNAVTCYVFLFDVSISEHATNTLSLSSTTWETAFQKSKWFSRGWTLQELIAPSVVHFFSSDGNWLGGKISLEQQIYQTTGIAIRALHGEPLAGFEIDERFAWAKHRQTKRQEDKAYSLLGIFNVHMPLIYGEGGVEAEKRLRRKILKALASSVEQEQELKKAKRVLEKEQANKLTNLSNLALVYWEHGRWKEAEELGAQMIETMKRVLGPEHPDTLSYMRNLTLTYWKQRRWKEAEELGVQVIETAKRVLGPEHPEMLTSMANLAVIYRAQGRLKEAEKLGVQAMEKRKRVLGPEHPDTLISMANLALTIKDQGRKQDAIKLIAECLQLRNKVLGADHPDALSSAARLARWQKLA